MSSNLSASILARLLALAKTRGGDYSLLLNRFALERLLCRLSLSQHADRFLLKGALLFSIWYDDPHRATKDADLLGFGPDDADALIATFRSIAAMDLGDGIVFDSESVRADAIREDNSYGGTRIHLLGRLGSARCALQIDVGFGDAVTPQAQTVVFPTLLPDFQAPLLRVYPVYTVIAEKYQAMVMLGQANSRMFARRHTALPTERPLALTRQFSEDATKVRQWQAFLNKNRIASRSLANTVALLDLLLWPATLVAAARSGATAAWKPAQEKWT